MNLPTLNRCLLPFKQPLDQLGMKGTNRLCTRALNYQELIIRSIVPGGGGTAPTPAPQPPPPVTARSFLAGCGQGGQRLPGEGMASVCACVLTRVCTRACVHAKFCLSSIRTHLLCMGNSLVYDSWRNIEPGFHYGS